MAEPDDSCTGFLFKPFLKINPLLNWYDAPPLFKDSPKLSPEKSGI
jgi:hypothetical protein